MIRERLREVQQVPHRLATRGEEAREWVLRRVSGAREHSEQRLWTLQMSALEGASELIDRASKVPVLERVVPNARDLLTAVEKASTAPPMVDYDDLNVRKILGSLHTFDRLGLLRIQHHEAAGKNRKTILDAIQRELDRRIRLAAA